jgi:hypothetical protein
LGSNMKSDCRSTSPTVCVGRSGQLKLAGILTAIPLILLAIAYYSGLARGLDHIVAGDAWGRYMYAISAALTDLRSGLPGYVMSEEYWALLEKNGFVQKNEVLHDPIAINKALAQAWNTKLVLPPPELQKLERGVRGTSADDLGFVDYAKIALSVFGPRIEGFYHLYFAILAVSVCVFVMTFWRSIPCMLVLIAWLLSFVVLLQSGVFGEVTNMGSVQNPRFASSIGVIAVLHMICAIFLRLRPSALHVIAVLMQSEIIYFAVTIRASASWMLVAIGFVWVVMIVYSTFRLSGQRPQDIRYVLGRIQSSYARRGGALVVDRTGSTSLYLRLVGYFSRWRPSFWLGRQSWSVAAFVVVFFLSHSYMMSTLHPLYRDGGWISHHAVWHSVYYSLMFNPNWLDKYGPSHPAMSGEGPAMGDEQPISAIKGYLAKHPPQDHTEVYDSVGNIKWQAMEKYVRIVFFEFVRNDPWFTLQAFVFYKPLVIYDSIGFIFESVWSRHPVLVLVAVAMFCYGYCRAVARLKIGELRSWLSLLWLLAGVALVSYIPNILTVVGWSVMAEQLWVTMAVMLLLLAECCRYVAFRWATAFKSLGGQLRQEQEAAFTSLGERLRQDQEAAFKSLGERLRQEQEAALESLRVQLRQDRVQELG